MNTSLRALAERLASRQASSVELCQDYLARIKTHNPQLNAFVTVDAERTLAEAQAADQRRAVGETGPLLGVPVAHKDIFCAEGWPSTCGSR